VDLLALYKLNKLHLHLTDDQGWRIEIKQYPGLTEKGAWRQFNAQDSLCIERAKEDSIFALDPRFIQLRDGVPYYGGYYTQDELRGLVAYAQQRHVEIIPEIDMPGHMMAAIDLYPNLTTTGKSAWGKLFSTPLNPVNEDTYTFIENVLTEVMDIFPSKYIHIGADEVDKASWKESDECRQFMKKQNLTDFNQLQSYFVHRVSDFLQDKGKEVIVWDDALEGGIDPRLHVMYWRAWVANVPTHVVENGNKLILGPGNPLYFSNPNGHLFDVYQANFEGRKFPTDKRKQLMGLHACLWTEKVPSEQVADALIYPRLLALSERAWTLPAAQDWDSFKGRLQGQLERLSALGVNYRYEPTGELIPFLELDTLAQRIGVSFQSEINQPTIYYTTDGSLPTTASTLYTGQFYVTGSAEVCAAAFNGDKCLEPVLHRQVDYHKAIGKRVIYEKPWNLSYPAGDAGALTDGLRGGASHADGMWQGFTTNLEVTVDLGKPESLHSFSAEFLQAAPSGIFLPGSVHVSVSLDGVNFKPALSIENTISADQDEKVFHVFEGTFNGDEARYLKVVATNVKRGFIFTDELVIN
ncbi:MAG: family 20 glycosylhydrolase, partial [Mangrovibacterium sp.]